MSNALETVGAAAAGLSAASGAMKKKMERARWTALGLAIVAAILGAVTATFVPQEGPVRWVFAFATILVLGLGPWLTTHFLGQKQTTRWVEVRAAAEALKREVFKRATKCKPYEGSPEAADLELVKQKQAIETALGDVEEAPAKPSPLPTAEIDLSTYIKDRVNDQITWMRKRAADHTGQAALLRKAEILIALVGVVLSALGAAIGETGSTKYLAPFIGVVTTISTALIAHVEASRYDFIAAMYRATARQLENERTILEASPSTTLPEFVEKCEVILSAENSAWMAKSLGA